jgi:hypothetical protein
MIKLRIQMITHSCRINLIFLNLLGGISGSPIKVLKNSVLRWRIADEYDNVHILSVQFVIEWLKYGTALAYYLR